MAARRAIRCPGTGAAKPVRRMDGSLLCPACGGVFQRSTLQGLIPYHRRVGSIRMAQYVLDQRKGA